MNTRTLKMYLIRSRVLTKSNKVAKRSISSEGDTNVCTEPTIITSFTQFLCKVSLRPFQGDRLLLCVHVHTLIFSCVSPAHHFLFSTSVSRRIPPCRPAEMNDVGQAMDLILIAASTSTVNLQLKNEKNSKFADCQSQRSSEPSVTLTVSQCSSHLVFSSIDQ